MRRMLAIHFADSTMICVQLDTAYQTYLQQHELLRQSLADIRQTWADEVFATAKIGFGNTKSSQRLVVESTHEIRLNPRSQSINRERRRSWRKELNRLRM
jgi:hypothetical protein